MPWPGREAYGYRSFSPAAVVLNDELSVTGAEGATDLGSYPGVIDNTLTGRHFRLTAGRCRA